MKFNIFSKKQFTGNYKSWDKARKHSIGYDDNKILKRAIHCRNWVLSGGAVYEQDLRMYHDKPFKPESLASLLWIYSKEGKLSVLDFGGSFGTSFYIHKDFLSPAVRWHIVEQENYFRYGKKHYETEQLKFYQTPEQCPNSNVLYLSGVLAYIENPYKTLRELLTLKIPYIIIDRNHFLRDLKAPTKLTIQRTNKMTVPTAFPCRLFNKKELMSAFSDYEIIREWQEPETASEGMYYGGCLLVLKNKNQPTR